MSNLFLDAGVISLAAFISPLKADRLRVKNIVGPEHFLEIFCSCPIEVCETRDVKGLYKQARAGEIKEFTGISSPYEEPEDPDLVLRTSEKSLEECTEAVINLLVKRKAIAPM